MRIYPLLRSGATVAALLLSSIPLYAANSGVNVESVALRPGVIVDAGKGRLFLMRPDNAVEAVNIASGETIWTAKSAAKPLALKNAMLVCQADPTSNRLSLVVLDVESAGKAVMTSTIELPPGVVPRIDNSMAQSFSTHAAAIDGDFYVSWQFQVVPMSGVSPPEEGTVTPQKMRGLQRTSGTVKMNARTGMLTSLAPGDVPRMVQDSQPRLMTGPPGAPPDPTRRISADGRHTLKSALVGDDRTWEKYRWSIVDNQTGKEIGEIRSFRSQSAFVVVGSLIIYETGAYLRRIDNEMHDEPLKIRSVDLESGKQVWNRPLRDTVYRGPLPP